MSKRDRRGPARPGHITPTILGAAVASLLGSLTAGADPAAAQADPTPAEWQYFGLTGLAAGQAARLNVAVIGPSEGAETPQLCRVSLALLNSNGGMLNSADAAMAEGDSRSLEYRRPLTMSGRLLVRATVAVNPDDPTINPEDPGINPADPNLPPCTMLSILEIVDVLTGRTAEVLAPVFVNPDDPQIPR